ncbi:hypothetical protein BIW11_05640, partial [Tropilaelaps mercedesae]
MSLPKKGCNVNGGDRCSGGSDETLNRSECSSLRQQPQGALQSQLQSVSQHHPPPSRENQPAPASSVAQQQQHHKEALYSRRHPIAHPDSLTPLL